MVPPLLCVADSKHAFFTDTKAWRKFFNNDSKYDWDVAPSAPDPELVKDIAAYPATADIKVYDVLEESDYKLFADWLTHALTAQQEFDFRIKKLINEDNFEDVFEYWHRLFGEAVADNDNKSSRYFLCDVQEGGSSYNRTENKVVFHFSSTEDRSKKILPKDYEWFWSNYEKVADPATIRAIITKVDRLTDEPISVRFTGEFFTP